MSHVSDRLARQYEEEKSTRWKIRYPILLFCLLGIALLAYFASSQNWIGLSKSMSEKEKREYNACLALRKIYVAQVSYRKWEEDEKNPSFGYARTIEELIEKGFLDRSFMAASDRSGYSFYLYPKKRGKLGFEALAIPPENLRDGREGNKKKRENIEFSLKSFYIDETGILRWEKGNIRPNSNSPKVPWKGIRLKE